MSEEEAARILGLDRETMPAWTQGLLITDGARPDNPIVFASRGFTKLSGYGGAEIVGHNCRFLQGRDTDPRTVIAIRAAVSTRRRFDGDILNYRKDGTPFWNHLSIGPLEREGETDLFVGLQFDVSFRYRRD